MATLGVIRRRGVTDSLTAAGALMEFGVTRGRTHVHDSETLSNSGVRGKFQKQVEMEPYPTAGNYASKVKGMRNALEAPYTEHG